MDQPTAGEALKRLEPLVGEWTLEAKPPDGPPWPGEARATIEWHDSGAHLVARSTVDIPEAPDSISINKAFTSRAFDIATKDLSEPSQPGGQFYGIHVSNGGRIRIFAGGIPLSADGGEVVGAISVSGGSGEQDQEVAEAGAAAF